MPTFRSSLLFSALLAAGLPSAFGQAGIDAALDLKPADETPKPAVRRSLRVFGELAVGRLDQRYGLGAEDTRRASLDLNWEFKPSPQWRAVLSNRLDDIHPVDTGARSTLNSLREAYVGWQSEDSRTGVDLGRVNLRYGPAYGFNPTDYFREGASRAVTTADPLALRENRLGTAMLRGQSLWDGGSVSVVLAPKLRDTPSRESFSADWGATNHAHRALVALGVQPGGAISAQAFVFHERDKGSQIGANLTALLGDSIVAFAEWSRGKDTELLSAAFDAKPRTISAQRVSAGATYTTASRLAVTAELEYNGFALEKAQWQQAVATVGIEAMGAYLYEAQRRQDIASRKAVLVYASQRSAFTKNLDLTGLVRYNAEDRSRFWWAEARYRFDKVDLALQWQLNQGKAASEYGAVIGKRLIQALAVVYF